MREILQVANDYFGTSLYQSLFDSLTRQGIENQVFVPLDRATSLPASVSDYVTAIPCYDSLDRLFFYSKQKKMIHAIEERWDVSQFDLIHAHTTFSGGYSAWKLRQKYHTPYIVAVRNTDVNVFFRYMFHLRRVGVQILRDAAAVIFLSPAYQESVIVSYVPKQLQQKIRAKSMVIPNGISDVFVEDRCPPHALTGDGMRLIYVGDISENKNVSTTVAAVEELRRQGLSATLTVVGPVKERKYEGYFEQFPFVTYLGKQPPEKVKEAMRRCDLFVMPSHTETFGLVYAEAMSQGLPVLYTRGQGFDGHFPDGTVGYAVNECDPKDVAGKIKAVAEHYNVMAQNAYELSTRFSWDKIAECYKKAYWRISSEET